MLVQGREEMSNLPFHPALAQLGLGYRLTAQAAKQYHKAGFTVVMQDHYYVDKLPYVLRLLASEPVQPIVLCTDADTARLRERQRQKTGYQGFDLESLHHAFMEHTPRLGLWIDNSKQTPQETVEQILRLCTP